MKRTRDSAQESSLDMDALEANEQPIEDDDDDAGDDEEEITTSSVAAYTSSAQQQSQKRKRKRSRKRRRKGFTDSNSAPMAEAVTEDESDTEEDFELYGARSALPVLEVSSQHEYRSILERDWVKEPPVTPEEYLLRVRMEAKHKHEQTKTADVSTLNLPPEQPRSRQVVDQFEEFRDYTERLPEAVIEECLLRFVEARAAVQTEVARRERWIKHGTHGSRQLPVDLIGMEEKYVDMERRVAIDMPKGTRNELAWKVFCFGGSSQASETLSSSCEGDSTVKPSLDNYRNEEEIDISMPDEDEQPASSVPAQEVRKPSQAVEQPVVSIQPHEPSIHILLSMDYTTLHFLYRAMVEWVIEDSIVDRLRLVWLHSLLLLLDEPMSAAMAASSNDLFLWCMQQRKDLKQSASSAVASASTGETVLAQLNALLAIISRYFKQGNASLV